MPRPLRRLILSLCLGLLAAACAEGPPPRRAPVMTAEALAPLADGSVIQVEVRDIPPGARVDEILLIAPDGGATPSRSREITRVEGGPGYGPAGIGIGVSGGSSGGIATGITVGVNSFGGQGGDYAGNRLLADIAVPDPALYRRDPRAWRIEVRWTDVTGQAQVLPLRAPLP